MSRAATRLLFLAIAFAALAALAIALWLQQEKGLLPCPLCVIQRIAFIAVALPALLAALIGPRRTGTVAAAALAGLFSLAGLAVAGRQVWLIKHPEVKAECGVSADERFLNALPLAEWWPQMFEANGDCARVTWRFLGYSLPELSLGLFALLAALALVLLLAGSRRR